MTIVIDVSYLQKNRAGYGHHTGELLDVLFEYDKDNRYKLFGWSYSIDKEAIYSYKNSNIQINISRIPGFIKRVYFNRFRFPDIKFFVGDFDIYHSTEPLAPPVRDKKLIITIHDLAYKKFPKFFEKNVLGWDKFIIKNIHRADAIIVPSQNTKKDVMEFFKIPEEKINVVYLPINKKYFSIPEDNIVAGVRKKYNIEFPYVLFVGTIEPRKNIKTLIKAFEEFHQSKKSDLNLVLVGKKGWMYQDILKSIVQSSFSNKIHILDYVPLEDLVVLYRLAKFFVYPSVYEGYGVPVIEAMACGLPVLTSESSSIQEIAKDVAIFFNPADVEELKEAMLSIDENESLRVKISQKGLERIKCFDRKVAAEKILNIYKKLSAF